VFRQDFLYDNARVYRLILLTFPVVSQKHDTSILSESTIHAYLGDWIGQLQDVQLFGHLSKYTGPVCTVYVT